MLTRILVPLDGSGLAEQALTYATALAKATGAELLLLRAATSHTLIGVDPRERQAGAIQEADLYLEQVAARLREAGFTCETVVPQGQPKACIVDQARTRHADLIVMATHGRTGPGRWIFGSVAEAVVANSPGPVLVQRSWQPLFGGQPWDERPELLVTLDGSSFAEAALEPAACLAEALHGSLALVRVEDDPAGVGRALGYLPLVQARLAAKYPSVPVDTDVRLGEAAYGIEEALAQRPKAALVVMATHGRSGAKRTVIGSIAGKIVQNCSVPVVLLHPAQVEDERTARTAQVEGVAPAG